MDCQSTNCENNAAVYVEAIIDVDGEEQKHSIHLCKECYENAMAYQKAKEEWK
jgi:hypothetical protein